MSKCQTALTTIEHDAAMKASLDSTQHQETIARRLGDTAADEWKFRKLDLLAKQKTVTFSTFCDWLQIKTRILSDKETQLQLKKPADTQTQSRE